MASKRKYGYYIKGNKIAIIEEGTGSGICSLSGYSSQTTCEDAGGTWTENAVSTNDGEYRSPVVTVTDGLEIQYAYSPTYRLSDKRYGDTDANRNYFPTVGWTVVGGYLTFLPPTSVNYRTSTHPLIAVDSYMFVEGSNRWNGIHKIQEVEAVLGSDSNGATHGGIKTYTKAPESVNHFYDTGVTYATDETISVISSEFADGLWVTIPDDSSTVGGSSGEIAAYPTSLQSSFIWICGSDGNMGNVGLFSNWKMSSATEMDLSESINWSIYGSGSALDIIQADAVFGPDSGARLHIYEAFLDPGFLAFNVDVMDDESFELDLSRYQANAIVYYVKAKLAEDGGNLEMREFFMREFKRQLEKGVSALKRGPYIVQGFKEMR